MRLFVLALCLLGGSSIAWAGCDREDFVLAIDIGHSIHSPGAISARGIPEYSSTRTWPVAC